MRVGLIGTGWWALGTPGPALAAADDVELVGVWGRDPQKTATASDTLSCAAFEDVDALIDAVDALAFAVPADVQAPLAVRAAQRGVHLVLEKPLAFSLAEADRVVTAIDEAGVASLVFVTDAYRPELDESRSTVRRGTWFGARATITVAALGPGSVLLDSPWRVARGALWDTGPHAISPLLESLGPVTEVAALLGARDTVQAVLRHGDTASSTVTTTMRAPRAAETWEFSWLGDDGPHHRPASTTPSWEAYAHALDDLRQAVGTGGPVRSPVDRARDVVAVVEAVQEALDGSGHARVPPARQASR